MEQERNSFEGAATAVTALLCFLLAIAIRIQMDSCYQMRALVI